MGAHAALGPHFGRDAAFVHQQQLFDVVKPDTGSDRAAFALCQAFVAFEDASYVLLAHADSVVGDAHDEVSRRRCGSCQLFGKCLRQRQRDVDVAAFRCVFQGVGYEVRKHLAEFVDIHGHDHPSFRVACRPQVDLFFAGEAGEAVRQAADVGNDVLPADRKRQRVVLDAAQAQCLVDQLEQLLDVVVDQVDQLARPFFVGDARQHVHRTVDQRERRAQLVGNIGEEVDLHVGQLLFAFQFRAGQLQFHLLQPAAQVEAVGEPGSPARCGDVEQKGVPRQQRRGFDDDFQPPRLLVPESVGVLGLQFEGVVSGGQVCVVGAASVLDVVPLLVDVAAVEAVGVADVLRREERHGLVADVDVPLLVVEDDTLGVVQCPGEGFAFRRVLDDAVDPDFGQHQRHGRFRDLGDDAPRGELRQSGVAAEIDHRHGVERAVGIELLGLEPVRLEIGDHALGRGGDERKPVGCRYPGVALGVLRDGGDFVAGEPVPESVAPESLLRVVAQQAARARADPQRAVLAAIEAGGTPQGAGDQTVGCFDAGAGVEGADVDGANAFPGHGGQYRRVVQQCDVLYVAVPEPDFLQAGSLPKGEPRPRGCPHPLPCVLAEAVDEQPLRKQRMAADGHLFRRAYGDPVVDIDPQAVGRVVMECRDAVALELLHERTVLRRVPPCGIFPVVVAQQPLVVAADPERAVVPDRDGVDEFAQRLFAEAWHLCEILFIGEADVVSAVGRTDPDVALAVAESAAEVARVVEFVEPVYDVAVEGVVREVDRMEVVALRADVDRAVVCRSQYRDVESGGVGQTPQQPGVGRGTSRCGVEGHDALLRAEPDTALPVAASAAEPRRIAESQTSSSRSYLKMLRPSALPPQRKPCPSASSTRGRWYSESFRSNAFRLAASKSTIPAGPEQTTCRPLQTI